jgi:hypothetical protein
LATIISQFYTPDLPDVKDPEQGFEAQKLFRRELPRWFADIEDFWDDLGTEDKVALMHAEEREFDLVMQALDSVARAGFILGADKDSLPDYESIVGLPSDNSLPIPTRQKQLLMFWAVSPNITLPWMKEFLNEFLSGSKTLPPTQNVTWEINTNDNQDLELTFINCFSRIASLLKVQLRVIVPSHLRLIIHAISVPTLAGTMDLNLPMDIPNLVHIQDINNAPATYSSYQTTKHSVMANKTHKKLQTYEVRFDNAGLYS